MSSVISNSLWPHGLWPPRLLCPRDSPGKNTAVGCYALLQGLFWPRDRVSLASPALAGFFTSGATVFLYSVFTHSAPAAAAAKSLQSCLTPSGPLYRHLIRGFIFSLKMKKVTSVIVIPGISCLHAYFQWTNSIQFSWSFFLLFMLVLLIAI